MKQITEQLFAMQDVKYRDFHAKLIPTVDKNLIIGVRTPVLRKFAKEINESSSAKLFLKNLPHKYYEENNLHGFLIEQIENYEICIQHIDNFLPFIDNWATCDLIRPKCFKKNTLSLLEKIDDWVKSTNTYTIRFGIEMLMIYYLDDLFIPEYLDIVAKIKSQEYYVNMMIAWFFATALAKQYDYAVKFIENKALDIWTHNKTISKAVESNRINLEQKNYLKKLKIK